MEDWIDIASLPAAAPPDGKLKLRLEAEAALPEAVFGLTSLSELWIHGPELLAIPETIGRLSSLTVLSVDALALKACHPALFKLPSLRRLVIRRARALQWPDKVPGVAPLEELRITEAGLSRIPGWFEKFKSTLRILDLSRNDLQSIGSVLSRFSVLTEVDLSHNRFKDEAVIDALVESVACANGSLKKIRLLPNPVEEKALKRYWTGDLR